MPASSSCGEWGPHSHFGAWASYCSGFSACGAQALGAQTSEVAARGLSTFGPQALVLCSMWNLPGAGIEPTFPALAGGFSSTVLPGKFLFIVFYYYE